MFHEYNPIKIAPIITPPTAIAVMVPERIL